MIAGMKLNLRHTYTEQISLDGAACFFGNGVLMMVLNRLLGEGHTEKKMGYKILLSQASAQHLPK